MSSQSSSSPGAALSASAHSTIKLERADNTFAGTDRQRSPYASQPLPSTYAPITSSAGLHTYTDVQRPLPATDRRGFVVLPNRYVDAALDTEDSTSRGVLRTAGQASSPPSVLARHDGPHVFSHVDQLPSDVEDAQSAEAPLSDAGLPHIPSRQSVGSETLESADYHSLSSPAALAPSVDDIIAGTESFAAEAGQPPHFSSPSASPPTWSPTGTTSSAWNATDVAADATASAAVAVVVPAVQVVVASAGRHAAALSTSPASASAPPPAVRSSSLQGWPSGNPQVAADAQLLSNSRAPRQSRFPSNHHQHSGGISTTGSVAYSNGGGGGGGGPADQGGRSPPHAGGGNSSPSAGGTATYGVGGGGEGSVARRPADGSGGGGDGGFTPLPEHPLYYQPFKDEAPVCADTTASAPDWVLLNVGGRLITTTVATLTADPDSMLAALCACLSPPPPPQRGRSVGRGGAAAMRSSAHHHNTTSSSSSSNQLTVATAAQTAAAVPVTASTSIDGEGDGDTQSLTQEHASGGGGGNAPSHPSAEATSVDGSCGPANADGDHSNPSPDPLQTHLHRHTAAVAPPPLQPLIPPPPPPPPSQPPQQSPQLSGQSPVPAVAHTALRASMAPPAPAPAVGGAGEERDGEVVNPQQPVSAVPLDADRHNAILLDLDADYFMPVLNYLRHGAVMIPPYINVDGVLAMAEYLNVSGLVRLLRRPPMPRRVLLFSWGSGSNGELGTHAVRDEPTPTMAQVTPFGVRVREIALGANYSCALTDSGHIYTFGNGEWGQLGLGSGLPGGRSSTGMSGNANNTNTNNGGGNGQDGSGAEVAVELLIPRRIPLFEQIPAVHVAAGYAFAMAIVENYHVYFWGNNNHGQSGRGRNFFDPHTKKVDAPVLVETLEGKRIIQLSCGSFFALALSEDGALYSWGLVDCVGLGTPDEVERRYHAVLGESLSNERRSVVLTPQLVTVRGRRRAGAAAAAAGGGPSLVAERIVRIRAGQWHSGAINEHGELFTWGVGYQGRLGHGSKTPAYVPTLVQGALEGQHVVDVACGSFHTVALTAKGDVFCWGDNASGQCGTTANNPDAFTAPYRVVGLEYVAGGVARSIACGRQHTVVVMEGPQPWCTLPCCQVDAGGRPAHSHAQVYCFGEVTRTNNGASGGPGVAGAVGSGAAGRGAASAAALGMPMSALGASGLPGSPSHSPFASSSTPTPFLPSASAHPFGFRPLLAGTAGHHHHPHYQLVSGLQSVDVRAVVSGLHHTFAYVEELMADDAAAAPPPGSAYTPVYTSASPAPFCGQGSSRHPYTPQRDASPWCGSVAAVRGVESLASARACHRSADLAGRPGGAVPQFYPRGASSGPMAFSPPEWGLSGQRGPPVPPHLPPDAAMSSRRVDASAAYGGSACVGGVGRPRVFPQL